MFRGPAHIIVVADAQQGVGDGPEIAAAAAFVVRFLAGAHLGMGAGVVEHEHDGPACRCPWRMGDHWPVALKPAPGVGVVFQRQGDDLPFDVNTHSVVHGGSSFHGLRRWRACVQAVTSAIRVSVLVMPPPPFPRTKKDVPHPRINADMVRP